MTDLYVLTRESVEARLEVLQAELTVKWAEADAAQAHADSLYAEAGHCQYHVDALTRQLEELS